MSRNPKNPTTATPATADMALARREAAELLGFDPDRLTASDRLKCELVAALRSAVDDELMNVTSARSVDLAKLITAVETLTRFLADAAPKENERHAIYKRNPRQVLEEMVTRWIQADEQDRRERGLPPRLHDEQEQQAKIDALERENARLRGESVAHVQQLPPPGAERVITPTESEVIPPGEIPDLDANKAPGWQKQSWTGPEDGTLSWLRPVPKTDKRVDGGPPVAKSGARTEAQRKRVNADGRVEHKVMGSARMVQPYNLSSGFFWGGASGKRAW